MDGVLSASNALEERLEHTCASGGLVTDVARRSVLLACVKF